MATEYIPSREAELVTWSNNFNARINATPAVYGLTAKQATAYGILHVAFVSAFQTANDPITRSPSNIIAKKMAMNALKQEARMLARIVQAWPGVTAEQRSELGLTVRNAGPTPIPVPTESPEMDVVSVSGHVVRIRLHASSSSSRRGKPAGVAGASVFSFVGETPSTDISEWKFEGNITRTNMDVVFSPEVAPGSKVWLAAFWFNPKLQSGPASSPMSTNVQFGGLSAAA